LRLCQPARSFSDRAPRHALPCWILGSCARDDNRINTSGRARSMQWLLTRRTLVTAGLTTAAGASGLGAAVFFAVRNRLIPPDYVGIFGVGGTLNYACQRLLHS